MSVRRWIAGVGAAGTIGGGAVIAHGPPEGYEWSITAPAPIEQFPNEDCLCDLGETCQCPPPGIEPHEGVTPCGCAPAEE